MIVEVPFQDGNLSAEGLRVIRMIELIEQRFGLFGALRGFLEFPTEGVVPGFHQQ